MYDTSTHQMCKTKLQAFTSHIVQNFARFKCLHDYA